MNFFKNISFFMLCLQSITLLCNQELQELAKKDIDYLYEHNICQQSKHDKTIDNDNSYQKALDRIATINNEDDNLQCLLSCTEKNQKITISEYHAGQRTKESEIILPSNKYSIYLKQETNSFLTPDLPFPDIES